MQNFVQKHDSGDANAQNAQNSRKAIAANAKVSTKRPPTRQPHPVQAHSGIPNRGLGNVQNTSATIQHAPSRRVSGQPTKRDPYDTDAESLDTTVNQSVVQVDDFQKAHQQLHHLQPGHIIDLGGAEEFGGEEEGSDDGDDEEEYDEEEDDEHVFTEEEVEYLKQQGQENLTRSEAFAYLQQHQPGRFRTIDGDSYPTTTEGDPSEWQGDQNTPSEDFDDHGQVSPSPQRHVISGRQPLTPPTKHREPVMPAFDRTMNRTHALYNASAAIRNQQRANNGSGQQPVQQTAIAPIGSGQTLAYSQANPVFPPQATTPQVRSTHQIAFHQAQQPQQNIARAPHVQAPKAIGTGVPAKRSYATRTKEVHVVPVVIAPAEEHSPVEQEQQEIECDYDLDALYAMKYDQLKDESFDNNPRAPEQPLLDNLLQKPLIDRLEHVKKNFESVQQSAFFESLPTTEWEDAGDWFLDQFSNIIARTKEARQKKRKLAQGFESEIEKRHKHISKKQHQVEDAMNKMKAQGEGLVPKSPRPSRSPRPRKG